VTRSLLADRMVLSCPSAQTNNYARAARPQRGVRGVFLPTRSVERAMSIRFSRLHSISDVALGRPVRMLPPIEAVRPGRAYLFHLLQYLDTSCCLSIRLSLIDGAVEAAAIWPHSSASAMNSSGM